MITETLDIPELVIPFYRGDTAVKRILLASDPGDDDTPSAIVATAGSPNVTINYSSLLLAGMNLYDSNGESIGTISSVGSGTAVLTANVTVLFRHIQSGHRMGGCRG